MKVGPDFPFPKEKRFFPFQVVALYLVILVQETLRRLTRSLSVPRPLLAYSGREEGRRKGKNEESHALTLKRGLGRRKKKRQTVE